LKVAKPALGTLGGAGATVGKQRMNKQAVVRVAGPYGIGANAKVTADPGRHLAGEMVVGQLRALFQRDHIHAGLGQFVGQYSAAGTGTYNTDITIKRAIHEILPG